MKKYQSPFGYYELRIPGNWSYSEGKGIVSFYNETNGVGALQISSYSITEDQNIDLAFELAEMVTDKTMQPKEEILKQINVANSIAHYYIAKNNKYWEYYMLFKNGRLLFVTYNCNQSDSLIEKEEIDKIIKSIRI